MDINMLTQMVEDITETKTLLKQHIETQIEEKKERKERQHQLDNRFTGIETRLTSTENTIRDVATSWKTTKWIMSTIIAGLTSSLIFLVDIKDALAELFKGY